MSQNNWNKRGAGGGGGAKGGSGNSYNNGAKKPRNSQEEDEDMMDFEEDEMEMAFVEEEGDDGTVLFGQEDLSAKTITYEQWERPAIENAFSPKKTTLSLQQVSIDHYISSRPMPGMPGARIGPLPVLR